MTMTHQLTSCDPLNARQFHLAIRKLADALNYGTDHSPFRGSGLEYVQSRIYQPGDPVKSLDWRVTARTGQAYVKEYEAPKRMPAYLLIDTSASMTFGSQTLTKYAWAVQIAGGLALACLDRVSPVGVLGVGERLLRLTPSLSKLQVLRWLHDLRHFRQDEATTLGQRLTELAGMLPNRALFFVLSDLHDPSAARALALTAQRHEVIALQLRDPAERGLPGKGYVRTAEAETGTTSLSWDAQPALDAEATQKDLRRGQVDHLILDIDRPIAAPLRHFLKARGSL